MINRHLKILRRETVFTGLVTLVFIYFLLYSQLPTKIYWINEIKSSSASPIKNQNLIALKMERDRPLALKQVKLMLDHELPAVESVKRRILIVTTWRSGSTFTMHLLSSLPATYSHFEPLMEFHFSDLSIGTNRTTAEEMVESLFRCQYNEKRSLFHNYLDRKPNQKYRFIASERVWNICRQFPPSRGDGGLCFDATFLQDACQLFPIQVISF